LFYQNLTAAGVYSLSPLGEVAHAFANFTAHDHDRATPYAPIALVLPVHFSASFFPPFVSGGNFCSKLGFIVPGLHSLGSVCCFVCEGIREDRCSTQPSAWFPTVFDTCAHGFTPRYPQWFGAPL
jgi:hypothetical protein